MMWRVKVKGNMMGQSGSRMCVRRSRLVKSFADSPNLRNSIVGEFKKIQSNSGLKKEMENILTWKMKGPESTRQS